jgi:DNA end-binding protein Ku
VITGKSVVPPILRLFSGWLRCDFRVRGNARAYRGGMAPRATWKGTLKFSLVTLPIKVFPATEASDTISFHQLHEPCQSRMQQKRWCPTCQREVPSAEIVKGHEFEKGKYVVLLEDELDAIAPESTRVIDLVQFAPAFALPFMAIDRAYYLAPDGPEDGPAWQAYAILVEALAGSVGIGKLAIYGREYLVAVSPTRGSLLLYTLHHAAELREAPHSVPAFEAAAGPQVTLARKVIAALVRPLDLADFTDAYQTDLQRLIAAKIAGQEIVQPVPVATAPVLNLREALTASLAAVLGKPVKVSESRRKTSEAGPVATAASKRQAS